MASLFDLSVSFVMPSADQMEMLELLIEHLDLCDYDDAQNLLDQNNLKKAQGVDQSINI